MSDFVIGLGGNLGDPRAAFAAALEGLAAAGRVAAVSSLWRTRAVGPSQPEYLNAAVLVQWPGAPRELLARCLEIEAAAGRDRSREDRWGPRLLDLDLLLARDVVCRGPSLELPHPRLHERRFALEPAAEVAPEWLHPLIGRSLLSLAATMRRENPADVIGATPHANWCPGRA